ncbi:hypothetical protein CDD83_5254 [Cordyceps sp. RAO-2017]|nr:hypothetical protein CDD83_5254 [Cordyceps sp. RAO-2017]
MAQPLLPGSDRIRSLQDEDSIYQAFDGYPWSKDKSFLSGLSAILGSPNGQDQQQQQGSPRDIATHARIFYYAQRVGVSIDFAQYEAWLAAHPDHRPPQVIPPRHDHRLGEDDKNEATGRHDPSVAALPWQHAAPKADLFVDRAAAQPPSAAAAEPNYPMGFAEMLRLLQEGKPIPGIRQIPNTVVRDPSVKPVGTRAAPKKPWEKTAAPSPPTVHLPEALDTDFPPVEPVDSASSDDVTEPQGSPTQHAVSRTGAVEEA